MKKRILAFLVIFAVILTASIGITAWLKPQRQSHTVEITEPEDALASILALKQSGAFQEAYQTATKMLRNAPDQADIAFEAGLLSIILRDQESAHNHMRAAWKNGIKKFSVLLVIIETMRGDISDKVEEFDLLFAELEQKPSNLNSKARFYSQAGRSREALEIWAELNKENPSEALVMQMARKLEMISRREEAVALLRRNVENIDTEGHNLLVSLLSFDNHFAEAGAVIESANISDPHNEWHFKVAMFHLMNGDLSQAESRLRSLIKSNSDHPVELTVAHEARICSALLRTIISGENLDFSDLRESAASEATLFPPREVTTPLLGMRASQKQIEAEQILLLFLEQTVGDTPPDSDLLIRLEPFLKDSASIRWLSMRNAMLKGNSEDAIRLYNEIDTLHPLERVEGASGFFYKSPLFITEAARAFFMDGREREALTLVNHLHERSLYTPASIQLFAEITQATGRSSDVYEMQEALGRQFKDDIGVQLGTVNQAVLKGDPDRALEILSPLVASNAENEELVMLELMLMIDRGDANNVLEQVASINLPDRNKNLIRARAMIATGNRQEAEHYFQAALDPEGFYAYLDYARFLVEEERSEEAAALYRQILEVEIDNLVAQQGLAIIAELNGNTEEAIWALEKILRINPEDTYTQTRLAKLHLQNQNPRDALQVANKVLSRIPGDPDASYLQLTAMIQLALQQPAVALQTHKLIAVEERLKEFNAKNPESPQVFLMVYLAAAYRDIGLSDRSGGIYESLLAADDSLWDSTNLNKSDVELALKNLGE